MKDGTKMLIPGVGAVADYYEGNYGSAATSAALDLFGASIIKMPLKAGISIIKVSELADRMPGMAALLRISRVSEIKILNRGSSQYAIIGETMERVIETESVAGKMFGNNVHKFRPSPDAVNQWNNMTNFGKITLSEDLIKTTLMWTENVQWITDIKAFGYNIVDIGIDFKKEYRGMFYNMEKGVTYK